MTSFDELVREVRSSLRGYGLVREAVAFLASGIDDNDLTIAVDDASGLAPGVVEIGSECVYVRSIDGNNLTVAPDGRGWDGTTAASHASGVRVTGNPPYPTWRLEGAINDAILGVFPDLFGIASTSFTYNPSVTTYSVPADTEDILKVTTNVLGPSQEQAEIHRYTFNSNAPTTAFATGNCLTLNEAPEPGRTVTVTYAKQPSALTSGDDFTDSGLRETAKPAVVYSALADLVARIDSSRATVDGASGHEYGTTMKVGTATQLAAQLTARAEMELMKEKERLRKAHPVRVRWGR